MRQKILDILRTRSETVSGEALRRELGVSRVTIWKHIQKLREMGYAIDSSGKGYCLTQARQPITPEDFPGWRERIHAFESVGSTMTTARELARDGAPHMTVVVAERQTAGRGRLDRQWASEPGGLFFSVVCRPNLPGPLGYRLLFSAGIALASAIEETSGVSARLKWPNDILVDDRKIAGMLAEMDAEADQIHHLILGIGVNVNNRPGPDLPAADSLAALAQAPVSRRKLLAAFLAAFAPAATGDASADVIGPWKARSATLGRQVTVKTLRETITGTAVDVDAYGALVVRLADGSERSVVFGDCFHTGGQG